MSTKTTRILSIVLMALPSLMVVMSGVMKLIHSPQMVENLTKGGLGNYITLFGLIELVSVILLWVPKTHNIGFLLLCCYLGGALSIELTVNHPPMAALLLTLLWIGAYLRNKTLFLPSAARA